MLKTTESTKSIANIKETEGKAGSNSVVGNNMFSDSEATNQTNSIKGKNQAKTTKSIILVKSKNHDFFLNSRNREARAGFLTLKARLAFIQLRQAFVEALILYYFDLECHIWIKVNASGYAIGSVLSQLASKTILDGIVTKTNLG